MFIGEKSFIINAGNKDKNAESSMPAKKIARNTKGDIRIIENFIFVDCSGIDTRFTYFLMLIKLPIFKSTNIKQTVIGILPDVPNKTNN